MSVAHPTLLVHIAYWVFALGAVVSGWRVFRTDSMMRATMLLLASFLNVGAILLLLGGAYLGIALLFMMTVEMAVMAIFMVAFMMNPAGLNPMNMVHQRAPAAIAGWLLFGGGVALAVWGRFPDRPLNATRPVIADLGTELMGRSMLIFETAGVTLVATMIGAVVLSSRHSRFGDEAGDEGSLPPALDPADPAVTTGADEGAGGPHRHHGGHR
ncbi:MAG: NADH-quinone oxidoreductase subunit J [Actinomycetota bacterium]|nr:NADH-quinone oxidoreductase subunit J [Actinomycetota bacterium]